MKYKVSFFRWKSMNWNDNKFQISQGGGEGKSVFEPNDQALDGIRVISAFACRPFSRRQMKNKFQSTGEGTQQINTLGINWNFKKCNVTKHLQWRLNSLIVLNCMSSLDVFVFVFHGCFCPPSWMFLFLSSLDVFILLGCFSFCPPWVFLFLSFLDVFVFVFLGCFCFHDRPRNVKQTLSL